MLTSTKPIGYTSENLADRTVLDCESKATFNDLVECHLQKLKPSGAVEAWVVEKMAVDFWRMSRRYHIDVTVLHSAAGTDPGAPPSAAERSLLAGYEERLRRSYKSSLRMLKLIRSFRSPGQTSAKPQTRRPNNPRSLPEPRLPKPGPAEYQTNPDSALLPKHPKLPNEPRSANQPQTNGGEYGGDKHYVILGRVYRFCGARRSRCWVCTGVGIVS